MADVALHQERAGHPDAVDVVADRRVAEDLPVALQGLYLGTSNAVHSLALPSFVAPGGFVVLRADEGVGWNHLDFKLPAAGGRQ